MKNRYLAPLYQLQTLLLQFDDDAYSNQLNVLNGSSVGQHTRHILEFYQCLYAGLQAGQIDYDARQRQSRIEQEVEYAQNLVLELIATFGKTAENLQIHLIVEEDLLESSLERELHYLAEHTIHHLAIIRIGLQASFPRIVFDKNLGVAPSTVQYRENSMAINC